MWGNSDLFRASLTEPNTKVGLRLGVSWEVFVAGAGSSGRGQPILKASGGSS